MIHTLKKTFRLERFPYLRATLTTALVAGLNGEIPADEKATLLKYAELPQETREVRIRHSPAYKDGKFFNQLKTTQASLWKMVGSLISDRSAQASPDTKIPILERRAANFDLAPKSGLRITWLGHSTLILEIDKKRFLIDPVWSQRASPFSIAGPERFHATPLPLEELLKLKLDAVLISHDHYDHLDEDTIRALGTMQVPFLVPLGVGTHLENWGIAEQRIIEADWWEEVKIGEIILTATPARHFSGRAITMLDRDQTLWSGWAIRSKRHNVYYSGDTGYFPGFAKIGQRLGPFDLAMIEVGAYNAMWPDVHLGPEQAVQAAIDTHTKILLPVHWSTFDLAMHAWTEPIERTIKAAAQKNISIITPRPGGSVEPTRLDTQTDQSHWWPSIPYETAEEAPVVSTGLTH